MSILLISLVSAAYPSTYSVYDDRVHAVWWDASTAQEGKYYNGSAWVGVTSTGYDAITQRVLDCLPYGVNISICGSNDAYRMIYTARHNSTHHVVIEENQYTGSGGRNTVPTFAVATFNNTNAVSAALVSSASGYKYDFVFYNITGYETSHFEAVTPVGNNEIINTRISMYGSNKFVFTGKKYQSSDSFDVFVMIYNGSAWIYNTTLDTIGISSQIPGNVCGDDYCMIYWTNVTSGIAHKYRYFNISSGILGSDIMPSYSSSYVDGRYSRGYIEVCAIPDTNQFFVTSNSYNGNNQAYMAVFEVGTTNPIAKSVGNDFGDYDGDTGFTRNVDCFYDDKRNIMVGAYVEGNNVYNNYYNVSSETFKFSTISSANYVFSASGLNVNNLRVDNNFYNNISILSYVNASGKQVYTGAYWNGTHFTGTPNLLTTIGDDSYASWATIITIIASEEAGEDPCECPGSGINKVFDLSDNCILTTTCTAANITFINTGSITINTTVNCENVGPLPANQIGYLGSNAKVYTNG